ncbi:hypothetical protein HQ312_02560 [Rhodococcus sp. BP-316]|uniref:hypothetical protein n=1 Tax=Rhodococcus sp. BP-316 TaxID=2739445 RepID=UPI001C9A5411|nr:hypothetical protein [Rhodococcus sp. BP-316]MBY6679924.1 hypothetical protein [Rhodococcus sp. BP-316]
MSSWLAVVPVAALVSATVTIALRWFDKPRVRIVFEHKLIESKYVQDFGDLDRHGVVVVATNVGDGTAYDIRLYGSLCDAAVQAPRNQPHDVRPWRHQLPTLGPGESMRVEIVLQGETRHDAALVVTWTPSPGRTWRRHERVALGRIPVEVMYPPGVMIEPDKPIPARTRRLSTLERLTPRAAFRTWHADQGKGTDEASRADGDAPQQDPPTGS